MFAVACLFVVAGCGSHGRPSDKLIACRLERQNEYGAAIVTRYYERGKLGTEAQIIREFNATVYRDPGFGRTFFDDNGHLIPYAKLTLMQLGAFNHWMYQSPATVITDVDGKISEHQKSIDAPCES